jgi:hypothetical protein
MELARQISAVLGVLLVAAALAAYARKRRLLPLFPLGARRPATGPRLEPVDRVALGPQQWLHLIRLGDRALVVSVSPAGCRLVEARPWDEVSASGAAR